MVKKSVKKSVKLVEQHKVPWYPPVVAFRKGSSIREAFAQWWAPELGSDLDKLLRAITPRTAPEGIDEAFGGEQMRQKWKVKPGKMVCVKIVLDYPLREPYERALQVSTKRIGDVFGIAHDLYREVYAFDDADWKRKGHKRAPIIGKKKLPNGMQVNLMNRQGGSKVWGHDLTDLVFEGLCFEPSPEARVLLDAFGAENKRKTKRLVKAKPLRFNSKHVIGTVTFQIGS